MGVDVDEARGHHLAGAVDRPGPGRAPEVAHGGDPVAGQPHVGAPAGLAGAVDHLAVCEHHVQHGRALLLGLDWLLGLAAQRASQALRSDWMAPTETPRYSTPRSSLA